MKARVAAVPNGFAFAVALAKVDWIAHFMKVLFFAQSRVDVGRDEFVLDLGEPVIQSEFWSALIAALPALAPHQKTARLARHETYLQPDDILQPTDEIAIIPPVSGG